MLLERAVTVILNLRGYSRISQGLLSWEPGSVRIRIEVSGHGFQFVVHFDSVCGLRLVWECVSGSDHTTGRCDF